MRLLLVAALLTVVLVTTHSVLFVVKITYASYFHIIFNLIKHQTLRYSTDGLLPIACLFVLVGLLLRETPG